MLNLKRLGAYFVVALSLLTSFQLSEAANYDPQPIGFGYPTTTVTSGNPLPVNIISGGSGGGAVTQSGTWTVQPGNTANTTAWLVSEKTPTGTPTQSSISVTTSSTSVLAASTATTYLFIQNQDSVNPIWLNLGGGAATANGACIKLSAGASYEMNAPGFIPTAAINAISTGGTVTVNLTYK